MKLLQNSKTNASSHQSSVVRSAKLAKCQCSAASSPIYLYIYIVVASELLESNSITTLFIASMTPLSVHHHEISDDTTSSNLLTFRAFGLFKWHVIRSKRLFGRTTLNRFSSTDVCFSVQTQQTNNVKLRYARLAACIRWQETTVAAKVTGCQPNGHNLLLRVHKLEILMNIAIQHRW